MDKKNILFFDDEKFTTISLINNLTNNYGYQIEYVSSISDLFNKLKEKHYDLIILDIMAPIPSNKYEKELFTEFEIKKMSEGSNTGAVVAEKIWDNKVYCNIPILFITAKQTAPDFSNKKTAVIRKPELAAVISREINKLLKL